MRPKQNLCPVAHEEPPSNRLDLALFPSAVRLPKRPASGRGQREMDLRSAAHKEPRILEPFSLAFPFLGAATEAAVLWSGPAGDGPGWLPLAAACRRSISPAVQAPRRDAEAACPKACRTREGPATRGPKRAAHRMALFAFASPSADAEAAVLCLAPAEGEPPMCDSRGATHHRERCPCFHLPERGYRSNHPLDGSSRHETLAAPPTRSGSTVDPVLPSVPPQVRAPKRPCPSRARGDTNPRWATR